MAHDLPRPEATFRIFTNTDKTYGVEIAIEGTQPTSVTSFATEGAAKDWIAGYQNQIKAAVKSGGTKNWVRR